eukprot:14024979-Alexandrium_andersonii.AAC.1
MWGSSTASTQLWQAMLFHVSLLLVRDSETGGLSLSQRRRGATTGQCLVAFGPNHLEQQCTHVSSSVAPAPARVTCCEL